MYNEFAKLKSYYFLVDIISLIFVGFILSRFYSYSFFSSKFFIIVLLALIEIVGVLSNDYSMIVTRGYLKELRASIFYGFRALTLFSLTLILGKIRFIHAISQMSYLFLILLFLLTATFVYIGRIVVKYLSKKIVVEQKQICLVTDFKHGDAFEEMLKQSHYDIIAYISHHDNPKTSLPILKNINEIKSFMRTHVVDEIVVSKIHFEKSDTTDFTKALKLLGLPLTVAIGNYSDFHVGDSIIKTMGEDKQIFLTTATHIASFRQIAIKRIMDIMIALVGVVITFFVAIIITPIVKKQSPGPLLFSQKRVGKNGKIFNIYKFRSMYVDAEERKKELLEQNDLDTNLMFKMEDDPRIFPFGYKLRNWSLDELPQFFNVLKGEMSVVGTRPPTFDEYQHYELSHFKRMTTKPGITGLWQVSGRSNITDFEEVVALDMAYIQNWSISEDIKIILKTFKVIVKREGSR